MLSGYVYIYGLKTRKFFFDIKITRIDASTWYLPDLTVSRRIVIRQSCDNTAQYRWKASIQNSNDTSSCSSVQFVLRSWTEVIIKRSRTPQQSHIAPRCYTHHNNVLHFRSSVPSWHCICSSTWTRWLSECRGSTQFWCFQGKIYWQINFISLGNLQYILSYNQKFILEK